MKETRVEHKDKTAEARFSSPIVLIQKHCWQKMYGWCRAAKSEVSGMGLARIKDGAIEVVDVYFPKQYCSSGWTELDEEALYELQQKLNDRLMKGDVFFRVWWHTHYNFDTFWSGQDERMAKDWAGRAQDWFLSIVINQKGDYRCRIDFNRPVAHTIDKIQVKVIDNDHKRSRKRNYKADIRKWVHPMPVRIKPKKSEGFVWTKDNIQRVKNDFAGTPWENQVNEWFNKHLKHKPYFSGRKGPGEGLKPVHVNYGGQVVKVNENGCCCMHTGDWSECFCNAECNICLNIQNEERNGKFENEESVGVVDT